MRGRGRARLVEEEEGARRGKSAVGTRALAGLFAPARPGEMADGEGLAEGLERAATLASGRAMRGRLWAEAKALAGLAESYGRLAARADRGELTVDRLPLSLIWQVLSDESSWMGRMAFFTEREDDPDNDVRREYHARQRERWREGEARLREGVEQEIRARAFHAEQRALNGR